MKIKADLEPGKVALITGGSSGIGKAIGCELAKKGMHVWLLAQRQEILDSARLEIEAFRQNQDQRIAAISADVSNLDQVHKAFEQVTETSGSPYLLINSAGITYPGYIQDIDINIFNRMIEVNYLGTVYTIKETLPEMIKRRSGYIVNISSVAGFLGVYGYSAYGASKFAVRGFSDTLRSEMRLYGIGVSTVFPPDTDTPQLEYENRFKPPETKAVAGNASVMSARDVAVATIKGIQRGNNLIFPGFESQLIFRLNCLFGNLLAMFLDKQTESVHKKRISSS
jgi:3-dehydrosphinganine reductase